MIKAFDLNGVQAASVSGNNFPALPAGGYEAVILGAKVDKTENGKEFLAIPVDITAGEFKDYFRQQFENSTFDDKKWKGIVKYFLPVNDGSKGDNFKKGMIKAMANALEASNMGYKWDWNEQNLKGKTIGIMVRDKEYDFIDRQGTRRHGFSPEVFELVPLEIIQKGEFSVPESRYLIGNAPAVSTTSTAQTAPPVSAEPADDDYPF